MCIVNWGQEYIPLIACFLDEMPADLAFELKSRWGLKATFGGNGTEEQAAFAEQFQKRLFSFDCFGPESQQFRNQDKFIPGPKGFPIRVIVPGNQTGCLSKRTCSYRPWENDNEQKCKSGSQTDFCASCYGSFCRDVTQYAVCMANSLNGRKTECEAAGGVFNNMNMCTFPADNIDQCFSTTVCAGQPSLYPNCQRDLCIKTGMTQQECSAGPLNGKTVYNNGICVYMNANKQDCDAATFTFSYGRWFMEGKYTTKAECDNGICTSPSLYGQPVDKVTCESTGYCTKPCGECQGPSVCVKTGVTTENDCKAVTGSKWDKGACLLNARNASVCASLSGTFASCGDLNTKDTCGAGIAGVDKCKWNNYGNCKTKESCLAKGECDDRDFEPMCQPGTPCNQTGVCFKPFSQSNNPGQSKNNNCNQGERRVRYGCIVDNAKSESDCDKIAGASWKTRAKTPEACAAYGNACKEKDRFDLNQKNATECAKCNGKMVPLYKWTGGRWLNGTIAPLVYMKKDWVPVNSWNVTMDRSKLDQVLQASIGSLISRSYSNALNKKYSTIFAFMEKAACACGSDGRKGCFGTIEATQTASCRADPGVESECDGIIVSNNTFGDNSSATVDVSIVSSSSFAGGDNETESERASLADVSSLAVISYSGKIVGQLVGNGKSFSASATVINPLQICLDVNPSIPQATTDFPIADFVKLVGNDLSSPLNMTITVTGSTLCADVTEQAVYFPVLRAVNFDSGSSGSGNGTDGGSGGGSGGGTDGGSGGGSGGSPTKSTTTATTIVAQTILPTKVSGALSQFQAQLSVVVFSVLSLLFLF